MSSVLKVLRDIVLLLARVAFGGIMLAHGWHRWRVEGIQAQVDYLHQFQTPYAQVAAWGSVILELVGGLFLIVGVLTPLVALAFVVQQVLIISYTKWFAGPYFSDGGWEYNVILGVLALLFVVYGAGRASVDRLFRSDKSDPDLADTDYDDPASARTRSARS